MLKVNHDQLKILRLLINGPENRPKPAAKDLDVLDIMNWTQGEINNISVSNRNTGDLINVTAFSIVEFFKSAHVDFTVELGVIKPGTKIYDQKKKVNAKIMIDGSIRYQKSEGSIHKVAAKILGAESCNGWTYWHYQSGNTLKPIDELRERLRPKN